MGQTAWNFVPEETSYILSVLKTEHQIHLYKKRNENNATDFGIYFYI